MKTQSIIQSSVNVIKLVNLKKGDVFKIIEVTSYNNNGITYNVVTNLYNDGEDSFIEVVQYTKSYSDINAEIKVFSGSDNISIFPCEIKEVEEYFGSAIKSIEQDINKKKKELQSEIEALARSKEFVSGELSKKIQSAEFKEITQEEYQKEKALKEAKLKELAN